MEEKIKLSFNNSEKELPKYPSSFDELKQLFFQLFPEENRNNTYAFYYYFLELPININEENFEAKIEDLYASANPIIYVQIENKNDDIFPTVVNSKVNEEQEHEQNNDVPSEKKSSVDKDDDSFNKKFDEKDFFDTTGLAETQIINKNKAESEENEESEIDVDNDNNRNEIEFLKEQLKYTEGKLEEEREKTNSLDRKLNQIMNEIENQRNKNNEKEKKRDRKFKTKK